MAPKTAKRAAVPNSPRKVKKARTDPVVEKCEAVVNAVEELAAQLPMSVRKMLGASAANCLTVQAADRDHLQTAFVAMIGQTMESISAQLQEDVAAKQAPVDAADQDKEALNAKVAAAETELLGLQEALTAAKTVASDAAEAFQAAKQAVSVAQTEQVKGDASLVEAEKKKAEIEATFNDTYNPLKEKAAKGKDVVSALAKIGKKYQFEETLLSAMGTAFMKEPAERGTFDQMVFTQYETTLKERLAAFTKELEDGDADRTARAAAVEAAKATASEKEGALDASKAAANDAVAAEKAGKAAVAAAKKAVTDFWPEVQSKMGELDKVKGAFTNFRDGPLAGFNDLKELAPAAPEPEEAGAEVEPVAQE